MSSAKERPSERCIYSISSLVGHPVHNSYDCARMRRSGFSNPPLGARSFVSGLGFLHPA